MFYRRMMYLCGVVMAILLILWVFSEYMGTQNKKALIKVGVTPGEHAQIMEEVKKVAAKKGLIIKVIEFSDYVQPNAALAAGDIDANSFQHFPYLEAQIKDRRYPLVKVGDTIIQPMGAYSKKIKFIDQLKSGAHIGIPNDPTNGGRALLLLEKQGIIKLKPHVGLSATPLDMSENPKKLRFITLDAAQLSRALDDVDMAVINGNYARQAGLDSSTDALVKEAAKDNPYANIMVVRAADKDQPWVKVLLEAYHNDEIKQYINKAFDGTEMAAW